MALSGFGVDDSEKDDIIKSNEVRYNKDQPRDSNGRFGSGGGSGRKVQKSDNPDSEKKTAFDQSNKKDSDKTEKTVNNVNYSNLTKITASNGLKINDFSKHMVERAVESNISVDDIENALIKPLHIDEPKNDDEGRPSQRFIGEKATVM